MTVINICCYDTVQIHINVDKNAMICLKSETDYRRISDAECEMAAFLRRSELPDTRWCPEM